MQSVNAKKERLGPADLDGVLKGVDEVVATRGKKVVRLDLRAGRPERAALEGLLLGPSGNLRAPALRVGRTLLVGFDEGTYRKHLG